VDPLTFSDTDEEAEEANEESVSSSPTVTPLGAVHSDAPLINSGDNSGGNFETDLSESGSSSESEPDPLLDSFSNEETVNITREFQRFDSGLQDFNPVHCDRIIAMALATASDLRRSLSCNAHRA
jgi:hypothetical protein